MQIFLIPVMYAVWTSCFSLGKITLQYTTPIFLTASRMLFASILILGYLFLKKKNLFFLRKKEILPIFFLSLFSIYLTNIFEFWSLKSLSASKVCFIYSLSPFFSAFFSYIHFKEKLNPLKILGMLIGIIGFFPGFLLNNFKNFSITLADLAVVGAALTSVYGWVLLRLLVKDRAISPLKANGWSMLFGGFLALIHSYFIDSWAPLPVSNSYLLLKNLTLFIFISNIFCYNLYGYLLKRYTATFLSFMGLLSPFFTSLTAWIFLQEKPSLSILISTCIIIFGLWIVYKQELKQGYIKKSYNLIKN